MKTKSFTTEDTEVHSGTPQRFAAIWDRIVPESVCLEPDAWSLKAGFP